MPDFSAYEAPYGDTIASAYMEQLLRQRLIPLSGIPRFRGNGLTALYYDGPFPAYQPLAERRGNPRFPIYVGSGRPLFLRMVDYERSLSSNADSVVERNISVADFYCRVLVLRSDDWIEPVERRLIRELSPLWNSKIVSGFGNNPVGMTRVDQECARWDVLHPGRSGSAARASSASAAEIIRDIGWYFAERGIGSHGCTHRTHEHHSVDVRRRPDGGVVIQGMWNF